MIGLIFTELAEQISMTTGHKADVREPPVARPTATRARLHQRYREPDGRPPAGLPQRQTLAQCADGLAMDRHRYAGGQKDLPQLEGLQAPPGPESRVAAPSASGARRSGH